MNSPLLARLLRGTRCAAALLSIAAASAAQNAPAAGAKDDPVVLNPFDVTAGPGNGYLATTTISATAMNTPLNQVPMSINVITSEFLQDALVGDVLQAFDYNSSITQTDRSFNGNRGAIIAIRGYINRNILLDGVSAGNFVPSYLVDRIEVVKGPNTLYGQSDPGGLVNIVAKRPGQKARATVTAKYGDFDRRQGELDLNTGTLAGKLRLRLLASHTTEGGWRPLDGLQSDFVAGMADFLPTPATTVRLLVSGSRLAGVPNTRSALPFSQTARDLNGDGDTTDTVGGVPENAVRSNSDFMSRHFSSQTKRSEVEQKGLYAQLSVQHRFNSHLDAQYLYTRSEQDNDVTFRTFNTFNNAGSAAALYQNNGQINETDSHTLNLLWRPTLGAMEHRILAGVRRNQDLSNSIAYSLRPSVAAELAALDRMTAAGRPLRHAYTREAAIAGTPIWNDDAPSRSELIAFGSHGNAGDAHGRTTSLYLTDSIGLFSNRVHVLGGLRRMEIVEESFTRAGAVLSPRRRAADTSYQAGAVYLPIPELSLFANVATAFNPNGFDSLTGQRFAPEDSFAMEAGLKIDRLWQGRLAGSLAVFQIDKENVVRSDYNPFTFRNDVDLTNDRARGVDAELFFTPNDVWQLVLNYSYLDAATVESRTTAKGLRLEGAPPHRFSLWVNHTVSIPGLRGLRLGGGMIHVEGPVQQFETSGNRYILEDGYTQFDLFARYETKLMGRRTTLGVNVSNLTDIFFYRARGNPNTPRTILGSVRIDL